MKKNKRINPFDVVNEQFHNLREKFKSSRDAEEKKVLLRRLINLVGVMEFLISINKNS